MMEQFLPGVSSAPNLHPMVVHFPIAFWMVATAAWLLAVARRRDDAWRFGLWLHLLGMLGAAVAVAFGFWATDKMGHDSPGHDLVHVHRDIMLWATGLALIVTALGWWKRTAKLRAPLTAMSVVLVGLLGVGADRGAELVFRYGMGVAHEAPPELTHTHSHDGDHGEAHEHSETPHAAPDGHGTAMHAEPEAHHSADAGQGVAAPPAEPSGSVREPAKARPRPAPHQHDHDHSTHEH